jgi:hypothetical protein
MTDNTMTKRKREEQTIQWSKEKEKDRRYNDQKKKRMTDNTMIKRKREGQTIQWPEEKGQPRIYKTLDRKLKIEQHEPRENPGVISRVP